MKLIPAVLTTVGMGLVAAVPAVSQAADWSIGIGIGVPVAAVAPPPVYVAPPPRYYAPPGVPVYVGSGYYGSYGPPPVYVRRPDCDRDEYYHRHRGWYYRHHDDDDDD